MAGVTRGEWLLVGLAGFMAFLVGLALLATRGEGDDWSDDGGVISLDGDDDVAAGWASLVDRRDDDD